MATFYIFEGTPFFISRAKCGYVTRAFMAQPGEEGGAPDAADAAAEKIDEFYQNGIAIPPELESKLVINASISDTISIVQASTVDNRKLGYLLIHEDSFLEDEVFASLEDAIQFISRWSQNGPVP